MSALFQKELISEIVNNKKQIILDVEQDSAYVYPNQEFEYTIFCQNVSNFAIENIHIQVINPENVLINEDTIPFEGIEIGTLAPHEGQLFKLKAICSKTGIYTVHFLCFGDGTGLFTQKLTLYCDYNPANEETLHRIHIYNFTPYEEKYTLRSEDYNENYTRLRKTQKLPYKAKQNPFSFIQSDKNNGFIIDESQNYLDQKNELYRDPINTDEHNYQYFERENFNKGSVEYFEGRNLIDIVNQINDNSKFFKAKFLKTGTNALLNDFKQYNPNGFFYRFGLMSSELYHHLGVLPEYSYMNDVLFRWAPDDKQPLNLYPRKVAMHWNTKKWSGPGYHVFKTYTDEYKNEIINSSTFTPLYEFIQTFDLLSTAQEYINKEYEFDTTNIYYITDEDGTHAIKKYQYIIKESYLDNGVFYIHIPINKIPKNFFIPSAEEIQAIVQKTKPFGMKPLIRYISTVRFKHNMSFNTYSIIKPSIKLHMGVYDKLRFSVQSYKYKEIVETICRNGETYQREGIKLIPCGKALSNMHYFKHNANINVYTKPPKAHNKLKIDMKMGVKPYECETDNNLSRLFTLEDILYQNNFENISFAIKDIKLVNINNIISIQNEEAVNASANYQLWINALNENALEQENPHSIIFDINDLGDNFDFLKVSLSEQTDVELGIGFKDTTNKYHGISAEYDHKLNLFNIKYATSKNNIFKVHKTILSELDGLAYKIIKKDTSLMVLFFIEKNQEFYYFHHIIIPSIQNIFCFIRNPKDIQSFYLSDLLYIGRQDNPKVYFNTPQYLDNKKYNPKIILTDNITPWSDINRIDENEYSYATIINETNNLQQPDDIKLHFDNIQIPDDAIVKNINIHAIMETNANKSIYCSLRKQDGFITKESNINQITLYPNIIEVYPSNNQNTSYYQEQYNIAKNNNIQNSVKFFEQKLQENQMLDDITAFDTSFLNNIEDYITIKRPYWCEISDFTNNVYSFNDIEECYFVIEGYNQGKEVTLISQLTYEKTIENNKDIIIPSGYFIKHIPLKYVNQFMLANTHFKFRFKGLDNNIDIFDMHFQIMFHNKQDSIIEYDDYNSIDIEGKKVIDINLLDKDQLGYIIKNGFTTKLEFDELKNGEYYRIYSIALNIIYKTQSIDFIANKDNQRNQETENNFMSVSGEVHNAYLSGMFFNDMPSVFQYESTSDTENHGIELSDTLYQSFVAEHDNITSVTLYPNGFVGNPNLNLKLSLYSNQGHTPGKLIKETNINGWSKSNSKLRNKSNITYNFNVNNLKIGETYWLKIEVIDPIKNNYYLLKYIDTPQPDFKLLTKINNNLINTFGSLKFQINSIHLYKSFHNIPTSQDEYNNPNIFIGLNRGQGYINNLKIKKIK